LINVEAARNDPNVRIYRNDAVINAERAFEVAITEVYKATRVFEYYTSQTYAPKQELFLTRMVEVGDFNLVSYLTGLQIAFNDFKEVYGNPDTRVAVFSMRDDVLKIPRVDAKLQARSVEDRISDFRAKLADGSLLDARSHLAFSFATTFERLSPLTRNHKILFVETELVGPGVGDDLARIYLRQSGSSTIQAVGGDKMFYQFPERVAVLNPFMNGGTDAFVTDTWGGVEIHASYRLRDRPFVNSSWSIALNQVDEYENLDIQLSGLDDIRLYVYYTDMTDF
ncbi:MAG TPA: hypothetical protein VGK67_33810, partial [Myxococcales bacterium]